jgi:PAS domain S-box-containing protein
LQQSFPSKTAPEAQARYRQARRRADRIVLIYVAVAALWILLSDRAVEWLFADEGLRAAIGTAKGWLFVGITATLLHSMLRHWIGTLQSLRERELTDRHLLEVIARNSCDAIVAKDGEGHYLFCNPAALHWLGKDADAVLGHDDRAVFPAAQAEKLMALDRSVMADGRTRTREVEVDTAHGRRVFLTTRGPLRAADGTITGVFGVSRDITERKRAEEGLRDRELKLQAIVMHSPSALSLKDREGRYVLANPNLQRILRCGEADIVGHSDFDLYPPEVAAVFRANDERVLSTLERHSVEEAVPVQGQMRTFMSHMFPVLDGEGAARYVCRISLDVTERKRAEQALTARNEELERFNRAMVGRELDMIELKRQVNALSSALGRAAPYPLEFDALPAANQAGAGAP